MTELFKFMGVNGIGAVRIDRILAIEQGKAWSFITIIDKGEVIDAKESVETLIQRYETLSGPDNSHGTFTFPCGCQVEPRDRSISWSFCTDKECEGRKRIEHHQEAHSKRMAVLEPKEPSDE
jgi:hypothetical protein